MHTILRADRTDHGGYNIQCRGEIPGDNTNTGYRCPVRCLPYWPARGASTRVEHTLTQLLPCTSPCLRPWAGRGCLLFLPTSHANFQLAVLVTLYKYTHRAHLGSLVRSGCFLLFHLMWLLEDSLGDPYGASVSISTGKRREWLGARNPQFSNSLLHASGHKFKAALIYAKLCCGWSQSPTS